MDGAEAVAAGLSPSEQMVIELVREGARDAEIAVRMSITIGDAKNRIAALVARLGLRERRDLVTWQPRPAAAGTGAAAAWPASAVGPAPRRRWSGRLLLGAAAVLGLPLLIAAFFLLPRLFDGSTAGPDKATVEIAQLVVVPPAPGAVDTRGFKPIVVGEPASPSESYALIVLTTPIGPASGAALQRIYTDSGGQVHREMLLASTPGSTLLSAVAGGKGDILATVCLGRCAEDTPLGSGTTRMLRSFDGGVSWQVAGAAPGNYVAYALMQSGAVVSLPSDDRYSFWPLEGSVPSDGTPSLHFVGQPFRFRDQRIDPSRPYALSPPPLAATAAGLLWGSSDGTLITGQGSVVLDPHLGSNVRIWSALPTPDESEFVVTWIATDPAAGQYRSGPYTGVFDVDGHLIAGFASSGIEIAQVLSPGYAIGTAQVPTVWQGVDSKGEPIQTIPVLIDLAKGIAHPVLRALVDLTEGGAHSRIVSVERGPFVRSASASCLPLFDRPQLSGRELECVPSGELLRVGEVRVHQDRNWLSVTTPAGQFGWLDGDYVE
jgi:DNA-binding CsgD family transcriptional regulator